MGVPETDLIEEMDLSSVECLNMVRPPARCHRLARSDGDGVGGWRRAVRGGGGGW
jgi:hypothetical protein